MTDSGYRHHLRSVVSASSAPYGYTLTLWTTGAIATHAEGSTPTSLDALLLLAGAVVAFGAVGSFAFGSINGILAPGARGDVRVWGGIHVPSVGISIGLVTALAAVVPGRWLWPVVGFASTATFLLVIGGQFWLATHRAQPPSEALE